MSPKSKDLKRKKPKKYYCSNASKKKKVEELEPGLKGFLITCNEKREGLVISEAYKLLNEYADIIYGPEFFDTEGTQSHEDQSCDNSNDQSIEEALKKEIEHLKCKQLAERRFQSVKTKVKNIMFIKTTLENPAKLVNAIFNDIEEKQLKKTRYCMKLLPVIKTCYASEKAIKLQIEELFREFFLQGRDEATYCIVFKARCNSTIKRDIIVPEVAKIIENLNEDWRVNYHKPDFVITLDIITNVCAVAILKDFHRFRKYNLQLMAQDKINEGDQQQAEKESAVEDLKPHSGKLIDILSQDENSKSELGEVDNCTADRNNQPQDIEKSTVEDSTEEG